MPWEYKKAVWRGQEVTVTLEEASVPENVLTKEFTWGHDSADGMNFGRFKNMVRGEIEAHLAHLNKEVPEEDVTEDFEPPGD